ncbi:MAG TPA: glycosyltransferase [Candidatus Nanoarchaeia archaeon]|nr:glycosyltransferase [Candidatus Nanoarchaeia archaeon]
MTMKVALIHDHLAQDGGAEKVLQAFAEIFPEAPIFTLLSEKSNIDKYYKNRRVDTSIIQKLPGGIKHYQWYMPFMPMAVEFFDLSKFDLVISDSASFAKGVITRPETLHIDYCHTPTRYLWSDTHSYINELKYNKWFKKIISLVLNYIRIWDRLAADRVDLFIANSETVKRRIKKYYQRDSIVIYPPVNTDLYNLSADLADDKLKSENYFLCGCRLAPYKRIDIVIEAFKKMPEKIPSREGWTAAAAGRGVSAEAGENFFPKLKIFGSGTDAERLKKIAAGAANIEFLGRVADKRLAKLYRNAIAFIHPQEEDFGITVIEAMACGTPVIAYRRGGATETIIENQTGVFFDEQSARAVENALKNFDRRAFDEKIIRFQAEKFSTESFKAKIGEYIDKEIKKCNDFGNWPTV